uniref:Uncharacterized protein n=1 Tax=Anguilla anguilla TaxID=7936 RepID=A0A0E9VGL7_ANGAN
MYMTQYTLHQLTCTYLCVLALLLYFSFTIFKTCQTLLSVLVKLCASFRF